MVSHKGGVFLSQVPLYYYDTVTFTFTEMYQFHTAIKPTISAPIIDAEHN